jgi:rhodanese-related sulfurtransferase
MDEISPQDLKTRLAGNDRPLLLDVRQDWETRLCRLENAVHIPIEEIELRVDELNADDEIVVYCHQGVRSAAVADYLRQHGFKNVKNLRGGLDSWAGPSIRRCAGTSGGATHGRASRRRGSGARSTVRRSICSSPP